MSAKMNLLGVYGASGFGREVMPVIRRQLSATALADFDLVFIDDNPPSRAINGHAVVTYAEWLSREADARFAVVAIANSGVRERISGQLELDGVQAFDVRAENVVQLDDVVIGSGAVLCPFVTLTSNIRIGKQFHANIYSYVAHDCVIGDYVTFAPGVQCNGNVRIEDHAYIGTGAVLRQGTPDVPLVIGKGAVIGMGAVVTKNVAPGVTVVGNPARPLQRA